MGLDQYLYIVKKIEPELEKKLQYKTEDYLEKMRNYLEKMRIEIIHPGKFIMLSSQNNPFCDYCLGVPVLTDENINQVKKDAALNEDYHYETTILSNNGVEIYFNKFTKQSRMDTQCVTLSLKHFNEILKKQEHFCTVTLMENIKYWRNNYELNDSLECDNCSYYRISESDLPLFKKHFDEREEDKETWSRVEDIVLNHKDDMAVFYYAWW